MEEEQDNKTQIQNQQQMFQQDEEQNSQENQDEEDIFSQVNKIQENLYQAGYSKGMQDQTEKAPISKNEYNYKEGFFVGSQIGKEVGQYVGFIESIEKIKENLEGYKKHKSQIDKRILSMKEIIMSIDFNTVSLDVISEKLFLLRSKFSALVSSLGLKKI